MGRRRRQARARRLQQIQRCAIAPTDLIVSVMANDREDWSFGEGRAQFLDGGL